jgi:DNA polymerase III delta prime subunit
MFDSIVGQSDAIVQLSNALKHPVNTYIFYGNRGTNIEECARIFAAHLIDETGSLDERVLKQIYSDVIEFKPIGVSYRIKEDVRESILSEMNKTPIEGEKKVLIIHDAHRLRSDSANSLLKSIEEPPENLTWILIAPTRDLVLPTIHSRCYPITFSSLSPDLIYNYLIKEDINEELAKDISHNCGGRKDRALNMAKRNRSLVKIANEISRTMQISGSYVSRAASQVLEIFDEITQDTIAENKTKFDILKKEMKDSGYSDKVQKSVLANAKTRNETIEKRLKSELMQDFLDYFQKSLFENVKTDGYEKYSLSVIDEFRQKLIYNPNETLYLESLFATLLLSKV